MKFKKTMLILVILLVFLTISVVSASDNLTDDGVGIGEDNSLSSDYLEKLEVNNGEEPAVQLNEKDSLISSSDEEILSSESNAEKLGSSDTSDVSSSKITVNAPKVTAYYKTGKYFKVTVKQDGKAVKNLKLKLKIYTGQKITYYTIKTNSNGVASFKTSKLTVGTHKVVISSSNNNYKVSKTSKIIIKQVKVVNGKYGNKNSFTVKVKDGSKIFKVKCVYKKSYKQYLGSVKKNGKKYCVNIVYEKKNCMQLGKKGWWTVGNTGGMSDNTKWGYKYNKYKPITGLITLHKVN